MRVKNLLSRKAREEARYRAAYVRDLKRGEAERLDAGRLSCRRDRAGARQRGEIGVEVELHGE